MSNLVKIPPWVRSLLPAVLLLAVGVLVFVYLISTPPEPIPDQGKLNVRRVRVFPAERRPHRMTATAYGTTRASEDWTAIAEVSGRVTQLDERFEVGEILPAESMLVQIDPTDYRLAEAQLQAEINSRQAEVRELEQNKANFEKILRLQSGQLKLAEEEFERLETLRKNDAASDSAMDAAQSAFLGYQTAEQETQNQLDLIPVKKQLIEASLDALNAQLQQARRNLDKCTISLPFAARCASKKIEVDQFVAVGERLGTFLALDTAEVVAMVEPRKVRALFPRGIRGLGTLDLTDVDLDESVFNKVEVPAEVRWGPEDQVQVWQGRVSRLGSGLDPATQSVPVVVEVPDPYKGVVPGMRPPLVPDLFCQVTFYGATVDGVVTVPADCLHEIPHPDRRPDGSGTASGRAEYCVYVLRDGKLHIAEVDVLSQEEDLAVIERGIEDGDMLILTDLFPASEGMPLVGEKDTTVDARLRGASPAARTSTAASPASPPPAEGRP